MNVGHKIELKRICVDVATVAAQIRLDGIGRDARGVSRPTDALQLINSARHELRLLELQIQQDMPREGEVDERADGGAS